VGTKREADPLMLPSISFPRLTATNHQETSPATPTYNCVAWAAEDTTRWWEPGKCWLPADWPADDNGVGALEAVFHELGYEDCADDTLEPGFQKVALYGSGFLYSHAARQLTDGRWTSKLGKAIDIAHDTPDVVGGGIYGEVVQIMKRRIA
jgi:hypothetical protein